MRIHSATLRNYRIHTDTTVEFDPRLTLITGLNESGKSTLAEGIHRGLFFKAGAGGRDTRDRMTSTRGGVPEVELHLEIDGRRVGVRKVFRPGRSECALSESGVAGLTGEAAEERLSRLLNVGEQIGGGGAAGKLEARWAHLWVWQGKGLGPELPTASVTEQQADLERRLQEQGGAAVAQTHLDGRVARAIMEKRDALFTAAGQPKSGSEPARAAAALDQARGRVAQCEAAVTRLDEAARTYVTAKEESERLAGEIRQIEQELAGVEERIEQARGLEQQLTPLRYVVEESERNLKALEDLEHQLAKARLQRGEAEQRLQPAQRNLQEAEARLQKADELARAAQAELERAQNEKDQAAGWLEALRKQGEAVEAAERLQEKRRIQEEAEAKRRELAGIREKIAGLPKVAAADVSLLRKLQEKLAVAEAELNALGARVDLIEGAVPVEVNGHALPPGTGVTIVEETEVRVGPAAILRIRPGGEAGIVGARAKVVEAKAQLERKLAALGVRDPDQAQQAAEELRIRSEEEARRVEDLERLDPDGDLQDSVMELAQEAAELTRQALHAAQALGRELPATRVEIRAAIKAAEEQVRDHDVRLRTAQKGRREAQQANEAMVGGRESARAEEARLRQDVADAGVRIQVLEQQGGSNEDRAERKIGLQATRQARAAELAALEGRLEVLQPAQLQREQKRLREALERKQESMQGQRERRAVAEQILRADGSTDPQADLEEAREAVRGVEARKRDADQRAQAVQMLATLLQSAQGEMADRLVRPLQERARAYLECLYGPGTDIRMEWKPVARDGSSGFTSITISRERAGLGSFRFEDLSGGTREQVGMALRFAMAEVLAGGYDGTLPVLLDDAFANSDPERIRKLQDMIYLAAERGLQVIVLSCTPQDYSRLGAKEIRLERPVHAGVAAPGVAPAEPSAAAGADDTAEPVASAIPSDATLDEHASALLAKLRELGGSSGNQSLREALGWDEAVYTSVRQVLLDKGLVATGRGRGGSLRLPEADAGS